MCFKFPVYSIQYKTSCRVLPEKGKGLFTAGLTPSTQTQDEGSEENQRNVGTDEDSYVDTAQG